MKKSFRNVQRKGFLVLAWTSFAFAVVGGAAAAGTFVGDVARTVFGVLPWGWIPVVMLIGLAGTTAVDLFYDGVPNRPALYSVIALPSLATAAPGKLGDTLTNAATSAMDWVDALLVEWLGTQSAAGIAIACVVASLILARRVVKSGKSGAMAGA